MREIRTLIAKRISVFLIIICFINLYAPTNKPSEPTKVCREGRLYELIHEGNITIFDRKAFMTCEEAK